VFGTSQDAHGLDALIARLAPLVPGGVAVEATDSFETVLSATAVAMQLKTILPACSWPAWAKQRGSILGLIILSLLCGRRGMKPAPLLGRRLTRRQIAHLGFSRGTAR
jgi:uncharacterized membrane protein YjjB (DUF3815 family)